MAPYLFNPKQGSLARLSRVSQDLLLTSVQNRLDEFCEVKRSELRAISDEIEPLIDYTQSLLSGGKRFRALFCYAAWTGYCQGEPDSQDFEAIVGIAAALEMFHAAALVHDDLLDQSDTRRGQPAIHKRFEVLHKSKGFAGDSVRFGIAGSVLVGDLMLSWASEIFGEALLLAKSNQVEAACRTEFGKMRFEVMAGQYLDVLEENAAPLRTAQESVARANRVMLYKTAKYSLEAPILIGSSYAGANQEQRNSLSEFAIPLGLAFQLRDDILGVFGDPSITGKPAGDDLREGKRTVLVGLTLQSLPTSVARVFEELLQAKELSGEQIEFMQSTISDCGALAKTERMIAEYSNQAIESLANLEIAESARVALAKLADAVINRSR